jgi:hypothetical protein
MIRSPGTTAAILALCLVLGGASAPAQDHASLFFLHHSTGRNLLDEGVVRDWIATYNTSRDLTFGLWDHDYNAIGLRDPEGRDLGWGYDIPGDNTDPDGLWILWTTANAARDSILANHDVIAFKSCFPASAIGSEAELAQRQAWYLDMRDVFDLHPDRIFVVVTQPPLHRLATDLDDADRARAFADWLKSDEYLAGHSNVVCFDLFDLWAHPDDGSAARNMLRHEYERSHVDGDSHPNEAANLAAGPEFARALVAAGGGPVPAARATAGRLRAIFR